MSGNFHQHIEHDELNQQDDYQCHNQHYDHIEHNNEHYNNNDYIAFRDPFER